MAEHARIFKRMGRNSESRGQGVEGIVKPPKTAYNGSISSHEVLPEPQDPVKEGQSQGQRFPSMGRGVSMGFGALLTFQDPLVERAFLAHLLPYVIKCDGVTYKYRMILAGLMLLSRAMMGTVHGVLYHALVTFVGIGVPLLVLHMIEKRQQEYGQNRAWMLYWLKPIEVMAQAMIVYVQDPLQVWIPSSLPHMLMQAVMRADLVSLVMATLGVRLPLSWYIYVQAVSSLHVLAWVRKLCIACKVDYAVREHIHFLGWRTEVIMARASLLGFPVNWEPHANGQYPCWLVGIFYGLFLEYFVPIYAVYILECSYRVSFLKAQASREESSEYSRFKFGQIFLATMYLTVCSQLLWFTMRIIWGCGLGV